MFLALMSPRPTLKGLVVNLPRALFRMSIARPELTGQIWLTVLDCVAHNFLSLRYAMLMVGLYFHYGPFTAAVVANQEHQIGLIDRGDWKDLRE